MFESGLVMLILVAIITWLLVKDGFFTVKEKEVKFVERFGKFLKTATPGLNVKVPYIDKLASGYVSLKEQELVIESNSITADNVSVKVSASVFLQVDPTRAYDAFYVAGDPAMQMLSVGDSAITSEVPLMKLTEVYANKQTVADAILSNLEDTANRYGRKLIRAQVTDPSITNPEVEAAINRISSAERKQIAAVYEGEAEKILETKRGEGIAAKNRSVFDSLGQAGETLRAKLAGLSDEQIAAVLQTVDYHEALRDVGKGASNTILLPHGSAGSQGSLIAGLEASKKAS